MRILFIAPSSYHLNGPEAFVNAKHVKLLCDMGIDVDLVYRNKRTQVNHYKTGSQEFFFSKVSTLAEVAVNTNYNLWTIIRHVKTLFKTGYVYKAADWAYFAIKKCEELIKTNHYDYVFTKDYPSEIVGVYLAKKYGVKWIPTWNDPYMWKKFPAPYGEGVAYKESFFRKKLIKDIGRYSYKNIFPSIRLRDYMLKYMYGMKKESCEIMPHIMLDGFVEKKSTASSGGSVLKIIHAGALGRERDPETFLKAVKLVIDKYKDAKLKVTLMGVDERTKAGHLGELISKYSLNEIIEYRPPVSYFESFDVMKEYDVCLIIEAACEEGIFLPSKVADYLQIGNSIFAISPKVGILRDLYEKGEVGYCADVKDVNDIKMQLEVLIGDFERNQLKHCQGETSCSETKVKILHNTKILV